MLCLLGDELIIVLVCTTLSAPGMKEIGTVHGVQYSDEYTLIQEIYILKFLAHNPPINVLLYHVIYSELPSNLYVDQSFRHRSNNVQSHRYVLVKHWLPCLMSFHVISKYSHGLSEVRALDNHFSMCYCSPFDGVILPTFSKRLRD